MGSRCLVIVPVTVCGCRAWQIKMVVSQKIGKQGLAFQGKQVITQVYLGGNCRSDPVSCVTELHCSEDGA